MKVFSALVVALAYKIKFYNCKGPLTSLSLSLSLSLSFYETNQKSHLKGDLMLQSFLSLKKMCFWPPRKNSRIWPTALTSRSSLCLHMNPEIFFRLEVRKLLFYYLIYIYQDLKQMASTDSTQLIQIDTLPFRLFTLYIDNSVRLDRWLAILKINFYFRCNIPLHKHFLMKFYSTNFASSIGFSWFHLNNFTKLEKQVYDIICIKTVIFIIGRSTIFYKISSPILQVCNFQRPLSTI